MKILGPTRHPRLNEAGNSVRSLKAIRDIAGELGVGVFGANPN